jgi:conjugative transfer signal peptidase TraF
VPDGREPPVTHCAEELRRIIAERRLKRKRLAIAGLSGFAVALLAASMLWRPPVLLVWNASASAPIGLYAVTSPDDVRTGEMVIAWTPEPARTLAAERRYLPSNVPLVKRVGAAGGDRVCAIGDAIWVNRRHVAARRKVDGSGRPMPRWTGCRDLSKQELFLMMDSPASFDGRYFGVTQREQLVGRVVLLWAKPAKGSSDG